MIGQYRFLFYLIIAVILMPLWLAHADNQSPPLAVNGVMDLEQWDFIRDGPLKLNGNWQFYWGRHIPPDAFNREAEVKTPPLYKSVPGVWNNFTVDGKKISGAGVATYRLILVHCDPSVNLGLKFLDIATSFSVYVNGRRHLAVGRAGGSREETQPFYSPGVIKFDTSSDTYDIVIHVSNFHHWLGGVWEPIFIGDAFKLSALREKRLFFSTFLMGGIAITGLYHLGLFWTRRSEVSVLLFGVFCLLMALRIITHGERYIVTLFPGIGYNLLVRMIYLSFYCAVPVFFKYTQLIFPKEFSARAARIVIMVSGCFIGTVLLFEPPVFSRFLPVFQGWLILVILYGGVCLARAIRNKTTGVLIFVTGFICLLASIVNDILFSRMIVNTGYWVPYGFFAFIFFQAYLISLRFSKAFDVVARQELALRKEVRNRKAVEAALKKAMEQEKYALVGQVAGKMAHDFNNILSIIMGNTELMLMRIRDTSLKDKLTLVLNQTIRGRNLTKNLVAFARDQEPQQDLFCVNEKIDLVLTLMKKDLEGTLVVREFASNLPPLLADPGMIEHALVNLLQNAIHATGQEPEPRIEIRTRAVDERIVIRIRDNGCGIPEKYLKRIYEPAFTLKGTRDFSGAYGRQIRGTGYGMTNIKKYIDQHNGRIFVSSQEGRGTTFIIHLPVIRKELTPEEIRKIREHQVVCRKRILVVEDNPLISQMQRDILSNDPLYHRVDVAEDGQTAISLFNKNTYDLVSLDYILPGKINGMNVYRHIRRHNSAIPVLFVSGNLEFLNSVRELHAQDPHLAHESKPCLNQEYVDRINRLLLKQ